METIITYAAIGYISGRIITWLVALEKGPSQKETQARIKWYDNHHESKDPDDTGYLDDSYY